MGFFNRLVTVGKTWIHIYIYICKIQRPKNNPRNRDSGSSHPKKIKTQKSSGKVLASVFWDKDGISLVVHVENGATITAKYYVALLDKLKQQLVSKRRGKLSKGMLFHQDNAAPHKVDLMHQKMADLHFEVLKHPAYSPDLAPLDYCLSPNLKKHFEH
jgi:histone-lysine N-methyltransferase SETMAR